MKITQFAIKNFRSLKDISIKDFDKTTIFYGDNNAGKSNILNALYLIFKRKSKPGKEKNDFTLVENFYEGVIFNSQNNFYNNDYTQPISFTVEVEFSEKELYLDNILKSFFKGYTKPKVQIQGVIKISSMDDPRYSDIKVESIKLDNKKDVFINTEQKVAYFPSLDKTNKKQGELSKAFSKFIDPLNDCVYIINSDRDMHVSDIGTSDIKEITPKTFKNFLYTLYLSPTDFSIFEQVDEVFSKEPFNFGNISFSKDGDNLEIMIKEKDFRLPIKHLGSGVLQTLYIIASIVFNKKKIVCIEELEQNLSPKKQYQILKKIQSMIDDDIINQIIISSHSSVYSKPKLGIIYFIEKNDGQSSINKKEVKKISEKLLTHLAPSLVVGEYTQEEWAASMKQVNDLVFGLHDLK